MAAQDAESAAGTLASLAAPVPASGLASRSRETGGAPAGLVPLARGAIADPVSGAEVKDRVPDRDPPAAEAPRAAGADPAAALDSPAGRNASMRNSVISKPARGSGASCRSRRPMMAVW
jgi:hypothetical protein